MYKSFTPFYLDWNRVVISFQPEGNVHFINARMERSFHSSWNGLEQVLHSGQNGMTPFHSGWNEMSVPFWPEWSVITLLI